MAVLLPPLLFGQNPHAAPSHVAQGTKVFVEHCVGCHGADAKGTDQGPSLVDNRALRHSSVLQLRNLIQTGIPGSGMPGFDLPLEELDALAALVYSLNAPAAEIAVSGKPAAGERFFFGKGQCASCHMVQGQGEPIGPDLSNLASEMTEDNIRAALLRPSEHVAPGYALVTVRLRDGKTLRGFARGRSNFDIRLQDLKGRIHLLQENQISAIQDEKKSLMEPVVTTDQEMQDLIAYLSRLTGVKPGVHPPGRAGQKEEIDFSRILNPKPGDWLSYNGKLNGNRYSELTQINRMNVNRMGVKWIFSVPLWKQFLPDTAYFNQNMQYFGLEATPIVADGIMYVTGPHSAYALDASTGRQIWEYSRPRTPGLVGDAALGTNRGVAILGDKVFMVTDDAHLIALNRVTGRLMWEAVMPDEPQHYGSTVAPLIVKDMVVAGVAGGDWGIRGFIAAYKASTGERVWRRWTIPAAGDPGYDTWKGTAVEYGGGATWLTGSFDPETDTIYWPTGNPFPDSDDRERGGDNLYANCILAMEPATGKLKWFYQFTPHDVHDWDSNVPTVVVDARYRGQNRKLLLHADRNGFFYVFDRTNGALLLSKSFIQRLTWASGIGIDGRPQNTPEHGVTCPASATNWNATAFSPVTRLYYVMAIEKCVASLSAESWKSGRTGEEPGKKYLRALDIETGRVVWERPQIGTAEGKRLAGVLLTAGGILIYGDPNGDVVAADDRNGKTLWNFSTGGIHKTSPMTYTVNGKQFIALAVGADILCFGLP
jgi:PQQ-dependent dehydrogenase (methanol/ethanol family)